QHLREHRDEPAQCSEQLEGGVVQLGEGKDLGFEGFAYFAMTVAWGLGEVDSISRRLASRNQDLTLTVRGVVECGARPTTRSRSRSGRSRWQRASTAVRTVRL